MGHSGFIFVISSAAVTVAQFDRPYTIQVYTVMMSMTMCLLLQEPYINHSSVVPVQVRG